MLNGYGERYGRALMWVGLTWLVFALVYGLLGGIRPQDKPVVETLMTTPWCERMGYGLLYSLENLLPFKFSSGFFQVGRTSVHVLSMIETLLGTTLFTFFVLALRRRFKR